MVFRRFTSPLYPPARGDVADIAYIFDLAAYHLAAARAHGLEDHQAHVHLGLFWGWAVERRLTARWLEDNTPEPFARYRRGEIAGPELLKAWDGALLDDMFSDEGLAFASGYLHFRDGAYLADYAGLLAVDRHAGRAAAPEQAYAARRASSSATRAPIESFASPKYMRVRSWTNSGLSMPA
jgi:hypothetical protein